MTTVTATRVIPLPRDFVFEAVVDVERYPELVPFVRSITVTARSETGFTASVDASVAGLPLTYVCSVEVHRPDRIVAEADKGPFETLNATWRFHPDGANRTRVEAEAEIRFRSLMLTRAVRPISRRILPPLMARLEKRLMARWAAERRAARSASDAPLPDNA